MQNARSMFMHFLAPPAPVMMLCQQATAWRAGCRHLPSSLQALASGIRPHDEQPLTWASAP